VSIGRWILDAWALLALVQGEEPAAAEVKRLIQKVQEDETTELLVSVINLGEVFYRLGREKGVDVAGATVDDLIRLGLSVLRASDARVFAAATQKIRYRVSYADAFALAAAEELEGTLVTGDPELVLLAGALPIHVLTRERP
jgi:ribonuclease VapC